MSQTPSNPPGKPGAPGEAAPPSAALPPAAPLPPVGSPPPAAPVAGPPALGLEEIEKGKTFAMLSYGLGLVGVPFFLVPLLTRDNEFALYHAKQCLILWLAMLAGGMAGGMGTLICCVVIAPTTVIVMLLMALDIVGLINASNGQVKPVPVLGPLAEEWFKGLTKAPGK